MLNHPYMWQNHGDSQRAIINFELSPDANSLFFFTNDTGPIGDDIGSVQMGIADVKTGEYLLLTQVGETPFYPSSALWRP
jgi:hypothetical protein